MFKPTNKCQFTLLLTMLLFGVLANNGVYGQKKKLTGVVVNKIGKPLPAASIRVSNAAQRIIAYTIADDFGKFSIQIPLADTGLTLTTTYTGYEVNNIYWKGMIAPDSFITIRMQLSANSLQEIKVAAAAKKMDTISYALDPLKKLYHQNLEQLLLEVPGLTFQDNIFFYKGKPISKILFEGDNISGVDYMSLLKSLSTHSVDSLQIIENYVDKTELGNYYKKYGNEVVINLVFKGKKNLRNFSRLSGAAGLPLANHELNTDNISFLKKFKIINVANYNTKGLVGDYLFAKSGNMIPQYQIDIKSIEHPVTLFFTQRSILEPNAINDQNIGVERLYKNSTGYFTSDFFYEKNQYSFFKGNIKLLYDKIPALQNTSYLYLDSGFTNVVEQSTLLKKQKQGSLELEYSNLPAPEIQLVSKISAKITSTESAADNLINLTASKENYSAHTQQYRLSQGLTRLKGKKNTLKTEVYAGILCNTELNQRNSTLYKELLANNMINMLGQSAATNSVQAGIAIKNEYLLTPKTQLNLNYGYHFQSISFSSLLQPYDSAGNKLQLVAPDKFTNNAADTRHIFYGEASYSRSGRLGKLKYSGEIISLFNYYYLKASNTGTVDKHLKPSFYATPSLKVTIHFTKSFYTTLQINTSANMPVAVGYYNGLVNTSATNFATGFDTLRSFYGTFYNANLSKSWKNKLFCGFDYTYSKSSWQQQGLYASNSLINFYKQTYIKLPGVNTNILSYCNLILKKISINLQNYLNTNKRSYVINQQSYKSTNVYSSTELNIKSEGGKAFSYGIQTGFNTSKNVQINKSNEKQVNKSSQLNAELNLNVSFLKRYSASLLQKGFFTTSNISKGREYYFTDVRLMASLNSRVTAYVDGRNLFNTSNYSESIVDAFYQVNTNTALLPRMLLFGFEWKF